MVFCFWIRKREEKNNVVQQFNRVVGISCINPVYPYLSYKAKAAGQDNTFFDVYTERAADNKAIFLPAEINAKPALYISIKILPI